MNNRRTSEYRERGASDDWQEASTQFPVLLLTGPRQAGKTTLLRHLSEGNRRYVTLDELAERKRAEAEGGPLRILTAVLKRGGLVPRPVTSGGVGIPGSGEPGRGCRLDDSTHYR